MIFILCLLLFLPKILIGFAVVHSLWDDLDFAAIGLKLGTGVAVGLALSSSMFLFATLADVPPQTYSRFEFFGFLILSLAYGARLILPSFNWKLPGFSKQVLSNAGILIVGFAISTYAFFFYAKQHPYGFEDAWSIWNHTARFVYRTNSLSILLDSHYSNIRFHPDYPINLGLNVAWGWLALNRETTSVPVVVAFLAAFSPALIIWGALKKWKGTLTATLGTFVFLMCPNLLWSVGQMADTLIALYMLATTALFYGYLRSPKPGLLILAGLLAGFSAWTKNEGLLFICVFVSVCAAAAWKQIIKWKALQWLGVGLIVPVLVVVTFKMAGAWLSDLFGAENSAIGQILDSTRWQFIGQSFAAYILPYGNWPISIVIVLFTYMLLIGFDSSESQRQVWLLIILAGQSVGYFGVYLITPHNLQWHITTSMERLISHLFPLALFWLFIATDAPRLDNAVTE